MQDLGKTGGEKQRTKIAHTKSVKNKITEKHGEFRRAPGGFGPPFPNQKSHKNKDEFFSSWTSLKNKKP